MIEGQGDSGPAIPGLAGTLGRRAMARAEAIADVERGQFALWAPVAIGCGIAIYFGLPFEPGLAAVLAFLGSAVAASLLARHPALKLAWIVLVCIAIGFTAAVLRTDRVAAPVLERRLSPQSVVATVDEVASLGPRHQRLLLRVEEMSRLPPEKQPKRLRLTVRTGGDVVGPGDRVELLAVLWPPPAPSVPGDFDFGRQLYYQGIGGLGVAVAPVKRLTDSTSGGTAEGAFLRWVEDWRTAVSDRIRAVLPDENGAIADALVTGYRAAISDETNEAMRNSGLYHMLSISGMHMSMVAGIVFFSIRALLAAIEPVALRFPIKKWAAFAAILSTLTYLLLSGLSVPAERAFLMNALVLGAVMVDRQAISLRVLALAAMAILLVQPDALLGVSFQMSFAAVIALIAGYEALRRARKGRALHLGFLGTIAAYLGALMASSLFAELAITPAALYHFNDMPLLGLVANLVAMPVTGILIMPALVLAVCLMPLGLESWPLLAAGGGIDLVRQIAFEVGSITTAVIHVPAFPLSSYILVMLGGLWLAFWRSALRYGGLILMLAGIVVGMSVRQPDILIEGDGDLVAVRGLDEWIWFSPGRGSRFARDRWTRMSGREAERWAWRADDETRPWLRCDGQGCLYRPRPDLVVAIVNDPNAFPEDCAIARIVISDHSIPRNCRGPEFLIGGYQRWRDGGQTFHFTDGDGGTVIAHETVGHKRNDRPWGRSRRDQ